MLLRLASAMLSLLIGLAVPVPPAHAQSAFDLGRLGSVPIRKQVKTLRELRFRELMPQHYDFSCGSAALGSLLRYGYGIEISETELIKQMLVGADAQTVVRNGFSMLDMKRYVEGIGMRAHGFRIEPEALYRLQMPVIALLDLKGYRHFVVVKGAASGRVFVADPALGHRVMTESDFVQGWNGIVLAVVADTPMRADSYLVNSTRSPALQQRVGALDRATTPPPVVEFGLVHVDLF